MGTCVNFGHCEPGIHASSSSSSPTNGDGQSNHAPALSPEHAQQANSSSRLESILPPLRLRNAYNTEPGSNQRPAALEPPSDFRRQHSLNHPFQFAESNSPVTRNWPSTPSTIPVAPEYRHLHLSDSPTYPSSFAYQKFSSDSESLVSRNARHQAETYILEANAPTSFTPGSQEPRRTQDDGTSSRHSGLNLLIHSNVPRYDYHDAPAVTLPATTTTWSPYQEQVAPPQVRNRLASLSVDAPLRLIIRQQPQVARACGFGERDRRVIDPPPILQVEMSKRDLEHCDSTEHCAPVHVIHASLWNEAGTEDVTIFTEPTKKSARRLVGTLVTSGSIVEDDHQVKGCFFIFADLSCRTNGRYRLRFNLVRLDPQHMRPGASTPVLASVLSDVMEVYAPKEFPGMRRPTPLTQALKNQGVSVPAKKSKLTNSRKDQESDTED